MLATPAVADDCTLLGVIAAAKQSDSIAVFECGETVRHLRCGQDLDGWQVWSVTDKGVVLKKGGESRLIRAGTSVDGGILVDMASFGGLEVKDNRLLVTEALRNYVADTGLPTILMQTCSELARGPDGEPVGYQLFEIDKGSVYDLIGLRDGDIVTEIDGHQLDSPLTALRILVGLKDKPRFSYSFRRAGVDTTRQVEIR